MHFNCAVHDCDVRYGLQGERSGKNVCPIDGSPPEWTGKRNGSSCEYLHYNAVERQTHSWWAACDLATPKKANQN
jgi:hypothetical protein